MWGRKCTAREQQEGRRRGGCRNLIEVGKHFRWFRDAPRIPVKDAAGTKAAVVVVHARVSYRQA